MKNWLLHGWLLGLKVIWMALFCRTDLKNGSAPNIIASLPDYYTSSEDDAESFISFHSSNADQVNIQVKWLSDYLANTQIKSPDVLTDQRNKSNFSKDRARNV